MTGHRPRLEPLEIATGMPVGRPSRPAVVLPGPEPGDTPRRALRRVVERALLRQPCAVSFSGGRDSSAVLAVAVEVSRREGLPPPVPVTVRFPHAARTLEDEWQERVVRHLGLEEWHRIDVHQELDLVGPVTTSLLQEHGLSYPPQVQFLLPVITAAKGGTVLTGTGGDELFIPWNGTASSAWRLARTVRSRAAVSAAVLTTAPDPVKRSILRRRLRLGSPWLTAGARRGAAARQIGGRPTSRSYTEALQNYAGSRSLELLDGSLRAIAHGSDVEVLHPFLDPGFMATLPDGLSAMAQAHRAVAMRELVGDLLPPESLSRGTKAVFNEALWGPAALDFARSWDRSGVVADLVDAEQLQRAWQRPHPPNRTALLLQQAWLAGREAHATP